MDISIVRALAFGWEATKKNYLKILLGLAVLFALNLANSLLTQLQAGSFHGFLPDHPVNLTLYILGFSIIQAVNIIILIGLTKEGLNIVRGKEGNIKDIPNHIHLFWKVLLGKLLFGAILIGSLLILTVPFIAFLILFSHASPIVTNVGIAVGLLVMIYVAGYIGVTFLVFGRMLIVDKEINPFKALEMSRALTRNIKFRLVGILLILVFINILGLALLGVGLLITAPITFFAFLHLYNQILKRMSLVAVKSEEEHENQEKKIHDRS
jgi:hypothetical protein